MFHRSKRLFLRPAWPEDWQALFGGIADEGVVRNLATAPWPYTPDDAREFAAKPQDPRYPNFVLTHPSVAGVRLIGMCGIGLRDGKVELGYWIARQFWGRGYATEAVRAVLEVARMLGHDHISAGHYLDNPASANVLRKAGFVSTGRVEPSFCLARGGQVDCAYYERDLTAEDFRPMQAA